MSVRIFPAGYTPTRTPRTLNSLPAIKCRLSVRILPAGYTPIRTPRTLNSLPARCTRSQIIFRSTHGESQIEIARSRKQVTTQQKLKIRSLHNRSLAKISIFAGAVTTRGKNGRGRSRQSREGRARGGTSRKQRAEMWWHTHCFYSARTL